MKRTFVPIRRFVLKLGLASACLFFAAATAVHVPALRTWVARLSPQAATCPLGGRSAGPLTASQRDADLQGRARLLAGEGQAHDLHFLGLALGEVSRAEVSDWAAAHALLCSPSRRGFALQCEAQNAPQVGDPFAQAQSLTAFFDFDGSNTLVEGRLLARFATAEQAACVGHASLVRARGQAGEASSLDGAFNADFLRQGLLRQARATFRRANLYAVVSTTNFGNHYDVVQQMAAIGARP